MTLEIRSFEGSPEDLSEFVVSAWRSTYSGRMAVPQWSADYFRWQLRLHESDSRKRILCAYEGTQPVGVLAHVPMTMEMAGEQFSAYQASWLSVPAESRGQGIATQLNERSRQILREEQARFDVGYQYFGSSASLGRSFWRREKHATTTFANRVGFWVRLLAPIRAGNWNVNRWEGRMAKWGAPLLGMPTLKNPPGVVIRPFQASDLPQVLELADKATQQCDLRLVWNSERLGNQLGLNGYGQAMVAEVQGKIQGCIGYHLLPMLGLSLEKVGVLDLMFVSELTSGTRTELLNSVLLQLRQDNAVVALKSRGGDYPKSTFLKWGWVWKPADSYILMTWANEARRIPPIRNFHLLWR